MKSDAKSKKSESGKLVEHKESEKTKHSFDEMLTRIVRVKPPPKKKDK